MRKKKRLSVRINTRLLIKSVYFKVIDSTKPQFNSLDDSFSLNNVGCHDQPIMSLVLSISSTCANVPPIVCSDFFSNSH